MENSQDYIDRLNNFAIKAIKDCRPKADESLQRGTILWLSSYVKDLYEKAGKLNTILIEKRNDLLNEAESQSGIDAIKLKDELNKACKEAIAHYISIYKPK